MQHNRKSMASRPKYEVKDVGQAVWWHDSSTNGVEGNAYEDSRVRCLMGEIHLSKDLSPSSGVIPFSVEVSTSSSLVPAKDNESNWFQFPVHHLAALLRVTYIYTQRRDTAADAKRGDRN